MWEQDASEQSTETVDRIMRHVFNCRACWRWMDTMKSIAEALGAKLTETDKKECDQIAHKVANRIISESN